MQIINYNVLNNTNIFLLSWGNDEQYFLWKINILVNIYAGNSEL